jgi:hypothetical protein
LHNGMLNASVLQFLDGLWSGISLSLVSTFVRFFVILYIIVSREFVFRLSRDGHSSCSSISVTDEVLWYLFVTYLAALLCIISRHCLSCSRLLLMFPGLTQLIIMQMYILNCVIEFWVFVK